MSDQPKVQGTAINPDEVTVAELAVRKFVNGIDYMGMNVGKHVTDEQCRELASAVIAAVEGFRNAPSI